MIFMTFESQYMPSYWWFLVTYAVSLTVSEMRPHIALNIPFKIAVKPLQKDTWLLLTSYRKLPPPYLMVPSQTPYDLPFSHNTARLALHSALW